jgi:hypothetical protein
MANEFATPQELKDYLGVNNANSDSVLTSLLTQISAAIRQYISRDVYPVGSFSVVLDGNGRSVINVADFPIISISSMSIDGVTVPARATPKGCGYVFDSSRVMLQGYTFTRGMANVSLSFTAGFSVIPADLKLACLEWAGTAFKERDRLGVSEKTFTNETTKFNTDIPKKVRATLEQWKAVVPYG